MVVEYGVSSLQVLESLGPTEKSTGRELIERLKRKSGLVGRLPAFFYPVDGQKELFEILDRIYEEEIKAGRAPILHFETHGEPGFMLLRNGEQVSWRLLAKQLAHFNLATNFNLLVVMACCDGLHQISALTTDDVCPFSALVGCQGTIFPSELVNGFELFYETLLNEGKGQEARKRLQSAVVKSKGTEFRLFPCEYAFKVVYEAMVAVASDPALRAKRVEEIRRKIDIRKAMAGNLKRTETMEVEAVFSRTAEDTLRTFHAKFFALDKVPENADRYRFDLVVPQ